MGLVEPLTARLGGISAEAFSLDAIPPSFFERETAPRRANLR
jgi:hypothetical protein